MGIYRGVEGEMLATSTSVAGSGANDAVGGACGGRKEKSSTPFMGQLRKDPHNVHSDL